MTEGVIADNKCVNPNRPSKEPQMSEVKTLQEQYRSLMPAALDWMELKDDRAGDSVVAAGYELEISRQTDDEGKPTKRWLWAVRLTSEISETPELYDAGEAASEGGAKRSASR